MGTWSVGAMAATAASSILRGTAEAGSAQQSAKMLRRKGQQDMDNARVEARNIRKSATRQVGAIRAAGGASGADVNVGPAVDFVEEVHADSERDAFMKLLDGQRAKNNAYAEARRYEKSGSGSLLSGLLGGATTVLAGGKSFGWWE